MEIKKLKNSIGNVIVIGLQGEGKSSLINLLLGKEVAKVAKDDEVLGETVTVTKYEDRLSGTDSEITLFDVPGYGNLKLNDHELLDLWKAHFSDIEVKAILYVVSLTRNRIFTDDIFLLEITRILFQEKVNSESNLPPLILVGTNADKIDNLESKIKETMQFMIKEINSYSRFKIKDYMVVSKKINNTNEINKLNNILLNSTSFARTKVSIALDIIRVIFKERMKDLGFECFDSKLIVKKKFNSNEIKSVYLKDVDIGDLVECKNGNFERVLTKTVHKEKIPIYKLIQFITYSNNTIALTPSHYMYVSRKGKNLFIPAKDVKVDDHLIKYKSDDVILDCIKEIKVFLSDYVLNIRTPTRTLIANDYLCSCVVEGDAGDIGHSLLLLANKIDYRLPQKLNKLAIYIKSLKHN